MEDRQSDSIQGCDCPITLNLAAGQLEDGFFFPEVVGSTMCEYLP